MLYLITDHVFDLLHEEILIDGRLGPLSHDEGPAASPAARAASCSRRDPLSPRSSQARHPAALASSSRSRSAVAAQPHYWPELERPPGKAS